MALELRIEPFDGPAGSRLVADLTADLDVRYADVDDPPACALSPAERAAREAARAAEREADGAAYAAEVSPADVVAPVGAFLVAYLDGEPVGCGAVKRHADGVAEVKRVWVAPAARGRGVARALMARLEAEAAALGYRSALLETGLRQPEAVALYTALGYRRRAPYGRYRDSPLTVCFERELPPPHPGEQRLAAPPPP